MANLTANSFEQLRERINTAQSGDIITINTQLLALAGDLPVINQDLTIRSVGDATISGSNLYRVFQVAGGNVVFENLTIENGLAKGTDGNATNPNGENGLGGGLLITGGNVTVINTNFQNNVAEGGNGVSAIDAGGNGGSGLGGAIYVGGGSLRISTSSFSGNSATRGDGGTGASPGVAGSSAGGAIFVNGGTVITEGTPRYAGNTADRDSSNTAGPVAIQNIDPPLVASISRQDTNPTAQDTVAYEVQFNQDVTGVDITDFVVVAVPPQSPDQTIIAGAIPLSVEPISGSSRAYRVVVSTGSGKGNIELRLDDNDSIRNAGQVPLGATGRDNGDFTGQRYFVDRTPPVANIIRKTPGAERTAADLVTYTVQFSEPVNGIDTDPSGGLRNFALVTNGDISGAQVVSVTPNLADPSRNTTYDVVVNTGNGNGTLALRLIDDNTIVSRVRGVPLFGNGTADGDVISPSYTLDKTPPQVASIQLRSNALTKSGTVGFNVTFTQDVTGISIDDFVPVMSGGLSGASIVSATRIDPTDNRTFNVIVNTGRGDGNLGLSVLDNDTIVNDLQVPLGGAGANNGNFTGQATYSVIKTAPVVSAISLVGSNPTAAATVGYAVTFNQDVVGVDASDFQPVAADITGASIASVSGSGNTYTVIVNTGNGNGTLGLNLVDDDSIRNGLDTVLGGAGIGNGNFVGQVYGINKTPPRAAAIERLQTSPNNTGTVNFTVSFSEAVAGVDPTDFALVTQGVTGAGITAVTAVNNTFYSVTVSTGVGDGTIGLNLIDNDSILNGLGLPLGGFGAGNGNIVSEVYDIDRTAPTANIVNVAPDPRRDKVDAITIRFSEVVRGFNLSNLRLTQNGRAVALNRATLSSADGINWTLGNIKKLTNERGDYRLLLAASGSGITDVAGNALNGNASDQWTNLVTVEACDPGITRRGTRGANRLVGTEDSDTLIGRAGNDLLIGNDCRDRLNGGNGDDRLVGGEGRDELVGGSGADRFIYAGAGINEALSNSLVDFPDRIRKFRFSESDKFQLSFNGSLNRSDRPRGLFSAGQVNGRSLEQAVGNAYRDKNQSEDGAQALEGREAVFFGWRNSTYLSVNNRGQGFAADRDLVINITGIQLKSGDAQRGSLSVSDYFA
jgi:hypothetical protein